MPAEDPVTQWVDHLREGDESAARRLWERYFERLAALANRHLGDRARLPADGEDVALSAFHSFCRAARLGRFPDLHDRDELWRVLITIAARKARGVLRSESRQKRGGGRRVGESALLGLDPDQGSSPGGLEQLLGREPTPDFAAEVAEECRRLLECLPDDELRTVAVRRMEGYTAPEIAEELGKALSTVERKLKLIRSLWTEASPPDAQPSGS